MKWRLTCLVLVASLLLTGSALAMESGNYRLDWFTPLTGSGGGPASSTHYAVNFTVGQTAIGSSGSAHCQAGLGYWYGVDVAQVYLPLVLKSH